MNQKQRDFLIAHINKTFKEQDRKHEQSEPKPPSLNNYLTAAVLDGSFVLQDADYIRSTIRKRVVNLGPDDAFLSTKSRWGNDDDEDADYIKIKASDLFEYPNDYLAERQKYIKAMIEWKKRGEQLEAMKDTITLKLQLGSNQALEKLIEQADNLCDLNLINAKLQLQLPGGDDAASK